MEKPLRHHVALLYSMPTCSHVSHSVNPTIVYSASRRSLTSSPVRLFVTPLQHFISPEYRHTSHPACRKCHYCSRYCKSTNGIITLSLCTATNLGRGLRSAAGCTLFAGSFAWRTREAKCKEFSVQHVEPFGRSLYALVCAACNFTKDFHPRLTLESLSGVLRRVAGWEMEIYSFSYSVEK